jgi:glutaredoxin
MKKYFLIIAVIAIILNWSAMVNLVSPPPNYAAAHEGKVVLYATSWCGYCDKARVLLSDHGIEFYEYDIESSTEGRKQFKRLGGKGVPLLLINGEVLKGFDSAKILKLVNKAS